MINLSRIGKGFTNIETLNYQIKMNYYNYYITLPEGKLNDKITGKNEVFLNYKLSWRGKIPQS